MLILCEVLRWQASEVAELLDTSVASVNSALQRARATLEASDVTSASRAAELDEADASCSPATSRRSRLRHRRAHGADPGGRDPVDAAVRPLARGPRRHLHVVVRAGHRLPGLAGDPDVAANGSPAFGQYKPSADGGYEPWALQVLELSDGRIVELTFFLDTETLFPLFGLPPRLDA